RNRRYRNPIAFRSDSRPARTHYKHLRARAIAERIHLRLEVHALAVFHRPLPCIAREADRVNRIVPIRGPEHGAEQPRRSYGKYPAGVGLDERYAGDFPAVILEYDSAVIE